MADTYTTNLNLTKPEPGAAEDTWGISLNADLDALDAIFSSSGTQINLNPNQINFADNKKAIFGAGNDLQIYSDGATGIIQQVGAGVLLLKGQDFYIQNDAGENFLRAETDGAVRLYYDNAGKLDTTSSGINVTGTASADILQSKNGKIFLDDNGTHNGVINAPASLFINFDSDNTSASEKIVFGYDRDNTSSSGGTTVMEIDSSGIDVTGRITTDGLTTSADINFGDDDKALFGAGNDLKIYHSANNQSYIHEVGSGDLNILATNLKLQDAGGSNRVVVNSTGIDVTGTVTSSSDVIIASTVPRLILSETDITNGNWDFRDSFGILKIRSLNDDLSTAQNRLEIGSNGDISFYDDTGTSQNLKWDASADSLNFVDNAKAQFGAGNDIQIYHNGITSNGNIENYTGGLYITNYADDQDIIFRSDDESGGVTTYFQLDGSQGQLKVHKNMVFFDNVKAYFGGGADLGIWHDATDSYIENSTGNIEIRNNTNDGDINFRSDNGSGGLTTYFAIDGGDVVNRFYKDTYFTDNVKAKFGSSSDLQIYHDGSHSRLVDSGTGNFIIQAAQFRVNTSNDAEAMIKADVDGAVTLYHNGSSKLATTSTGVEITGNLDSPQISINDYISHNGDSNTYFGFDSADTFALVTGGTTAISADANATYLRHQGSAKLATTSAGINVTGEISGVTAIRHANSNAQVIDNDNDTYFIINDPEGMNRILIGDSGDRTTMFRNDTFRFQNASGTERARFDSSGNLLIGKTSSDFSVYGLELVQTGVIRSTVGNGHSLLLNRKDSDGEIINLRKDNTTVGSIGVEGGNNLFIGSTALNHSGLNFTANAISPMLQGSLTDATVALGTPSRRFTNLHLSGQAIIEDDASSPSILVKAASQTSSTTPTASIFLSSGSLSSNASAPAIISYRDADYSTAALRSSGLKFQVTRSNAGSEAMRIDSIGRVGIGTSSPTETLHVMSGVSNDTVAIISGSQSDRGLTISTYASDGRTDGGVDFDAYKSFKFTTDGSERARFNSSGQLLIGKTATDNTTVGTRIDGGGFISSVINGGAAILLNRLSSDGDIALFRKDGTTVGSLGIQSSGFYIDGESSHSGLRFSSSGLVPRLNSADSDNTVNLGESGIRFKDLHLSGNAYIGSSAYAQYFGSSADTNTLIQFAGSDDIRFRAGGTEQMRIKTTGVGIGTSSPSTALHVSAPDGNAELILQRTGAAASSWGLKPYNGDFFIRENGTDRVTIKAGGNFGINTTSPASPLHVNGNVQVGIGNSKEAFIQATNSGRVASNPAYSFNGDVDTGMFNPNTDNTIAFATGGSERARIDSSGRVGVGVSSPSAKLEVKSSGSNADEITLVHSGNTVKIASLGQESSHGSLILRNNGGTNQVRLSAGGNNSYLLNSNFGIGTSSPVAKLDVLNSTANAPVATFTGNYTANGDVALSEWQRSGGAVKANFAYVDSTTDMEFGTTTSHGLGIKTGNTRRLTITSAGDANFTGAITTAKNDNTFTVQSTNAGQASVDIKNTEGHFRLITDAGTLKVYDQTDSSERFRIDSSGNLGIGDTAPQDYLEINGSGKGLGGLTISNSTHNHAALSFARSSTATARIYLNEPDATHTGQLNFQTSNASGGSPNLVTAMVIDENQRVGIGTTSPSDKLSLNGAVNASTGLTIGNNNSTRVRLYHSDAGGYSALTTDGMGTEQPLIIGSGQYLAFYANGSERARFDTSGRLGLGTSSPTEKMEISGGHLKVTNAGNANIYINADQVGSDATVFFEENDSVKAKIQHDASNDSMLFTDGAYTDTMTLKGAKVGIGTTAPTSPLHVSGAAKVTGTITVGASHTLGDVGQTDDFIIQSSEGNNLILKAGVDSDSLILKTTNTALTINPEGKITIEEETTIDDDINLSLSGSVKGKVGVSGSLGDDIYIASGTTSSTGFGLRFIDYNVTEAALPCRGDGSTADNLMDLGNSGSRFDDIYATNGTINTSDKNEKQDIQALTEAEQRVATACKGLIRRFRWQDAVEKKGDDARYHFGVIAQDLQDAFEAEGLDAGDYGMFISSTWTDDEGNEQTRLGVRYNELLAFIITTL